MFLWGGWGWGGDGPCRDSGCLHENSCYQNPSRWHWLSSVWFQIRTGISLVITDSLAQDEFISLMVSHSKTWHPQRQFILISLSAYFVVFNNIHMNTFPLSPLGSVQINTMNTKLFLKHKLHLQLLLIYTEHFFFCFIKLFQFKTASVRLLILHCDCIKTVYSSTSAEEKQFLIRSFEVHSPHREMNKAQNKKKNAFNVYCLTEKKKKKRRLSNKN